MRAAILLAVTLLAWLASPDSGAHEIRPAYLEITENAQHRFDVLWKQPSNGTLVLKLTPRVSNGLLDSEPAEESFANSFVVRWWENLAFSRDSFDGATVSIDGLEFTITDALVNISFANGQEIQEILGIRPILPRFLRTVRPAMQACRWMFFCNTAFSVVDRPGTE